MRRTIFIGLVSISVIFIAMPAFAQNSNLIPGITSGTGNYFEIKDSKYLNITLKSTENIEVVLESIPKTISLNIKPAPSSTGTIATAIELAINGLEPSKTYYKYQDSYKNLAVFVSDENGSYKWTQDLTQPHYIWFQEKKGTIFLPEDCSKYGNWSEETQTCILNQDLNDSMEITQDNITLDCNGHKTNGLDTGMGILLFNRQNVKVKNCEINNFSYGIIVIPALGPNCNNFIFQNTIKNNEEGVVLSNTSNENLIENIISSNNYGVLTWALTSSTINKNIISNNAVGIISVFSSNNTIVDNNISDNETGIFFEGFQDNNKIYHNNFINNVSQVDIGWNAPQNIILDNDYPDGGNYWSDYSGIDEKSGPEQDQPGNDGIGDTPYNFNGGLDGYPFMKENGWQIPPLPQKWSFAIITDLHIGRGYPDYDGTSYDDGGEGEDYYLTERLNKVVDWINESKNKIDCDGTKCPTQFLVVLGDIADSAEKAEFIKAREILNKLNDPNGDGNTNDGIPYVVVFGNHDVWPYYTNSDGKDIEAESSLGEQYFDEVFWDENATNTKMLEERLNFQRDDASPHYKNFVFKYGEINLIGLDFASRATTSDGGVKSEGVIFSETENWLKNHLNEYQGKEAVILFSHFPFAKPFSRSFYSEELGILPLPWGNFHPEEIEEIKKIIEEHENIAEGKQILGDFGGHIHGFEKFGKELIEFSPVDLFMDANWEYPVIGSTSVITTEALMVSGNEKDISIKGVIRIVKVNNEKEIDSSNTEGKFPALNPRFDFDFTGEGLGCLFFKANAFTKRVHTFSWDFGDGNFDTGALKNHCYGKAGKYEIILTAKDNETGEEEKITRRIEIKEEAIYPRLIKIKEEMKDKIELISTTLDEDLTKFGRTIQDVVLVRAKYPESMLIGLINIHFEQATRDVDLSNVITEADLNNNKFLFYNQSWPDEVEQSKVFFIPMPEK